MSESLAESLLSEQSRVREILGHYKEIGVAGDFGAMMIEESLCIAEKAVMEGDIAAMISAHENLKGIK